MPERTCQRAGCGRVIPSRKRKDARWCSRSCESKARRQAARRAAFEASNPGTGKLLREEGQSLGELHDRTRRPDHWDAIEAGQVDDDLIEFSDTYDVHDDGQDDDHQDDDHQDDGLYVGPGHRDTYDPDAAHRERMELAVAVDAINADFEFQAAPYLAQQKRNPGPMLPQLAQLMRERDSAVSKLTRDHQRAEAYALAELDGPRNRVSAHDRAVEQAAARAFAADLGRNRHLRDDHADIGRDVRDAWVW
jgi:hypothetical protein